MDDLTWPQWYAQDVGLAVFPLQGKVPYPGSRGCLEATTDLTTIRQWEGYYGDCNWGVATGEQSGVFVVDVDDWDSWMRLVKMHGNVGEPWISSTPSGGVHLWYAHPSEGVRNSASSVAAGVDVRGEGGYIVAPPSVLPNGAYTWDEMNWPERLEWPSDAPDWLLRLIWQKRESRQKQGYRAAPMVKEGGRHDELVRLAGYLRRIGLEGDEIKVTLDSFNQRRCVPPWPQHEVDHLAYDAHYRWEPAPTLRVGGAR